MKTSFAIIVFLFYSLDSKTQCLTQDTNLVLNPGFENYTTCPPGIGFLNYAQNWFNPTANSPDYFNSCSPVWISGANVPDNFWGNQAALNGVAYGGLALDLNSSNCNRDYLGGYLFQPLSAGLNYYFEMWISVGDSCTRAINKLGVYFSNSNPSIPLDTNGNPNYGCLPYTPQIIWDTVISDTANWVRLQGNFIATGGEQFFVIGCWKPNDSLTIDTINFNSPRNGAAYYYVDDVKVSHCDSLSDTTHNPAHPEITLTPNPGNGNFYLNGNFPSETQIKIYNMLGQLVWSEDIESGNRTVPIFLQLAAGVYVYWVGSGNDVLKKGKLVIEK